MQPMVLAGDGWKLRVFRQNLSLDYAGSASGGNPLEGGTHRRLGDDEKGTGRRSQGIALKLPAKQGMAVLLTRRFYSEESTVIPCGKIG